MYDCIEKQSDASKKRRVEQHKEYNPNPTKKSREHTGKKPDFSFKIRKSSSEIKIKFKLLVENENKTKDDRYKLYRMMKDIHDYIFKTYISKFSGVEIVKIGQLEIYRVLVTGFKLIVFVLDRPGYGLYRVRKVDEVIIPVKKKDDKIILVLESLM
ncbi:7267_t:CDS:2, partial [Entrophospora sp. SA101]